MPQRRRRIFFIGYLNNTSLYSKLKEATKEDWIEDQGVIGNAFPCRMLIDKKINPFELSGNLVEISDTFNLVGGFTPFQNAGVMVDGIVYTSKTYPLYDGDRIKLRDILQNGEVTD